MFLLSLAFARLPHDVVLDVVAAPQVPANGPWFALINPARTTALLRSPDGGKNWVFIGNDPVGDLLVDGAALSNELFVLRSESRLWWSENKGDSWLSIAIPEESNAIAGGDMLYLATPTGAWAGLPDSLQYITVSGGLNGISVWNEGAYAYGPEGIWELKEGVATSLGQPPVPPSAISRGIEGLFIGSGDGSVWHYDPINLVWTQCGAVPTDGSEESVKYPDIVEISQTAGTVLVLAGWQGPFVSEDGCQSWQDRHVLDPLYFGEGAASTPEEAFTALLIGESLVVGGWMGVASSLDAGQSWQEGVLLGSGYTRGLAFSPDYQQDRRIFIGTLGAAAAVISPGGDRLTPAQGFTETNTQGVWASSDAARMFAIVQHLPWRSVDGGKSWIPILGFGYAGNIKAWTPDHIWLAGKKLDNTEGIYESLDGGETWAWLPELGDGGGGFYERSDGLKCLALREGGLICEAGPGWEQVWEGSGSGVEDGTAFKEGLVLADGAGLWWVDEQQTSLLWERVDDPVISLTAGGDYFFGFTRSGLFLRGSLEGVELLDLRTPSEVTTLVASPEWATEPYLLAATLDGVFKVEAADTNHPVLFRWQRETWVDDLASMLSCVGCTLEIAPKMSLSSVSRVGLGQRFTGNFQGKALRILGVAGPEEAGIVLVDGVKVGDIEPIGAGTEVTILGEYGGFSDGWHSLEIRGTGALGLRVDGFVGLLDDLKTEPVDSGDSAGDSDTACCDSGRPPKPSREEEEGCKGCKGENAGIVLLLWLFWKRR